MDTTHRPGRQRRRIVIALLAAPLAAGVVVMPADAATAPPAPTAHTTPALPKIGPRAQPFSARTHTAPPSTTQSSYVDAADYPWIVAIRNVAYNDSVGFCVGEIISPTKVLTAAACDIPPTAGSTEVIAGRNQPGDDSVGFVDGVSSVWTDPDFISAAVFVNGKPADVQVLTLTLPLPSVYTPITMTAAGDQTPYALGTTGYTLSYGYNIEDPAEPLFEVPITAISPANGLTCALDDPLGSEVCESYPGGGAIGPHGQRNLGDPLVVNGLLAGVGDAQTADPDENAYLQFEKMSDFHDLITADLARTDPGTKDWTGDGISDLLGEGQNGQLTYYEGDGAYPGYQAAPGFANQAVIDQTNWSGAQQLLRVDNWTYDGTEGLLTVTSNGTLYFYPNTPSHGIDYAHAAQVGTGWNMFSTIVATNNFTGDGRPDLLAVRPDGTLWLYERTGNGWVNGSGAQIGNGFSQFAQLMPFQWTDTGHIGLLGVTPTGDLRFYSTDGGGHWVDGGGAVIGAGFTGYRSVFSVGSFGGTDTGSLMTVDTAGNLTVYSADGKGGWINGSGLHIGVGFQTLKKIF